MRKLGAGSGRIRRAVRAGAVVGGLVAARGPGLLAQGAGQPDFNAVRTPASPAFVLLGVEPTAVARPNTPADFAASVLNAAGNGTVLPKDFALETSPYWLFGHPRGSWHDDVKRNVLESIQRTFTLSVATADLGTTDTPISGLALSGRMALLSGVVPEDAVRQIEALEAGLAASAEQTNARLSRTLDGVLEARLGKAATAADSARVLEEFNADKAALLAQLASTAGAPDSLASVQKMARRLADGRHGLMVDLAGGMAFRAPRATVDSLDLDRWGIWLTASYTLPDVSFVGTARYLGFAATNADAVDIGARFIVTRDQWALSAEYVGRHVQGGARDLWRLAGVVDYRVSPSLWVTGTFGRGYDDTAPGSLVAQFGLSLNMSKERYGFGP